VLIVLVAQSGSPLEADDAKLGNRGKRDSQIVLMAFLQKVMLDEKMTTNFSKQDLEGNWCLSRSTRVGFTFVRVDVDTKGFPDSLSRMVNCMVHDEQLQRNKDCEQSGDLRDDDAG